MHNPISTYRIQFHKGFTFADFEKVLPYLHKLGVSTIYASPITTSVPGSTHGYDGLDPQQINPEIGTLEDLKRLSNKMQSLSMNWLQDIVPNHMAFHPDNKWLMDVMEKGAASEYARFFDIALNQDREEKLMVPFLGRPLDQALENRELGISAVEGRFVVKYFESEYPLNEAAQQAITAAGGVDVVNANGSLLKHVLATQSYRLCHWQETDTNINFRRFFTVNGLICLNIQEPEVFTAYHKLAKSLLGEGVFTGLRIDHIDGLHDPEKYLHDLRDLTGDEAYIVVEKILQTNESIPSAWPIQGNTGYDFLALVNNLFTNRRSEEPFTSYYSTLVGGSDASVQKQIHEKKSDILYNHMGGELDNLYRLFISLDLVPEAELTDAGHEQLKKVIGEMLILCPVYRYYGNSMPLPGEETKALHRIFRQIRENDESLTTAVDVIEASLLLLPKERDDAYRQNALRFYQRLMQFSGPLMAKGVEDTLMYTYNRFIGHNEVGDSPEAFGISTDAFHKIMLRRQALWPLSINTTSTHDTKRGEDARARLNVLTDLGSEWLEEVEQWRSLNADLTSEAGLDANDEYFIYQTLIATHPMPGSDETGYAGRLQEYVQKALREARQRSSWSSPNEEYEAAAKRFARALLEEGPFSERYEKFLQKIAEYGVVNSLAQMLLKFTCPGIPDTYQGTELWDLSLVDPDNRRAVDYARRKELLDDFETTKLSALTQDLWESRTDGRIKQWLTHRLLNERRDHVDLFRSGHYIPLEVEGKYKDNVFAFARRYGADWLLVAVPLHIAQIAEKQKVDIPELDWKNTRIILPAEAPPAWKHLLAEGKGKTGKGIAVGDLFNRLPLALVKLSRASTRRGAGILLPIASLPSSFGIGDFGPSARAFADFLSRSGQKFWQLLPLNPTEEGSGYSPYSSYSSLAGNTLLLSPELLREDNLLTDEDLKEASLPSETRIDYRAAEEAKALLYDKAWQRWQEYQKHPLAKSFRHFCREQAMWLDDFALFLSLREHHDGKPWTEWEQQYKARDKEALKAFATENEAALLKSKWLQFLFSRQWQGLKEYCASLGVVIFGDIPFYVSHHSADVWANPDIFCIDKEGHMTGIAGVPPDYFTADGQLWGMPTFRWDVLKARGYDWWIYRLKKNLELFDLLRIDHFRAMAEYWQVPAGEETAVNGRWLPGPGTDFFTTVEKKLGKLPFVAEDLGDNMEKVYALRDKLGLPGMKVLQFAFGENIATSVDAPHNHTANSIVYTGTHDNNTTTGWYRKDAWKEGRKSLEDYLDRTIKEKDVAAALSRIAYSSVGETAILPMQDVLALDEKSRLNTPGEAAGNWQWRLKAAQLDEDIAVCLLKWTRLYNR